MTLTSNEAETLHLLVGVMVPRIVSFLAVAIGPWALWAAYALIGRMRYAKREAV